jgi:hypothetical protein
MAVVAVAGANAPSAWSPSFLIMSAGAAIITGHDALTEEGFFNQA